MKHPSKAIKFTAWYCGIILTALVLTLAAREVKAEEPKIYTETEVTDIVNATVTGVLRHIAVGCLKKGVFELVALDENGKPVSQFFLCKPIKSI